MKKIPLRMKGIVAWFKTVVLPAPITQLILQTVLKWQRDDCWEMGAALAYYALFSLFPVCLVMLSIFGFFLGNNTNYSLQLIEVAQNILPQETVKIVQQTVVSLHQSSIGAGVIGFALLILTASRIFDALNRSVDKIWSVAQKNDIKVGVKYHAFNFVKNKIFAILLVLSTVFVFFLSMLANLVVRILSSLVIEFGNTLPWIKLDQLIIFKSLETSISYGLIASVIFSLFKALPSVRLFWYDVIPGAMLTAGAMMGLQNAVSGGIIHIGESFRAYGIIGNVMVLLLWIYLVFQVFFLGCEFTFVFTHLFGSRRHQPRPF